MGVGIKTGHIELQIPLLGEVQSVTPVQASFLWRTEDVNYKTTSVEMTTLDEITDDIDVNSGVITWVDIEGLTLDLLAGGLSLFASDRSLMAMLKVDQLLASDGFIPVMCDAEL